MASAAYTTDLVTLTQAEESGTPPTGWAEPTATGWTSLNAMAAQETDFFIQGSYCVSATVKTGVGGVLYDAGASGVTIPTDGAFLVWCYWSCPGTLAAESSGGMRLLVGSALNAFNYVNAGGNDLSPNPYGGWMNLAMGDPAEITTETGVGSPGATRRYFGWCYNCPTAVPSKGNPFGVDAIRYGRCSVRITGGQAAAYGTFAGIAAQNDSSSNRWGLFQAAGGIYSWKGRLAFGASGATTTFRSRSSSVATLTTAAAHKLQTGDVVVISGVGGTGYNGTVTVASVPTTTTFTYASAYSNEGSTADTGGTISPECDFRDSNVVITIQNTKNVTANFNLIEIQRANSRVDFTNVIIIATGTQAKGVFTVTDNATVNLDACSFKGMGAFTFQSNTTVTGTNFVQCGLVTQGSASISGCAFNQSAASAALLANDIGLVLDCDFISSGTGHGLQGLSAAGTYDLTSLSFTGYAADDGSTGNEAIYVTATTGTVTLNLAASVSVRTAGATIVKNINQVTLTISPIVTGSDVVIYDNATGTILDESQDVSGTSFAYVYDSGDAGTLIDIGIFKAGYTPLFVRGYELGAASATAPVSQEVDRFYIA